MAPLTIDATAFVLDAFLRAEPRGTGRLVVYIEGDAPAWRRGGRELAQTPPPSAPLALALAARDPSPAVAWLGRPCQGVLPDSPGCEDPGIWSRSRFSREVVDASDRALDALRERTGAAELELVGYSGGGVLAALLAARRPDVVRLVTVAAPLALGAWRAHHGLAPLDADDPASVQAPRLATVPQLHFAGTRDEIVPVRILEGYCRERGAARCVVRPHDAGHGDWREGWAERIAEARRAIP